MNFTLSQKTKDGFIKLDINKPESYTQADYLNVFQGRLADDFETRVLALFPYKQKKRTLKGDKFTVYSKVAPTDYNALLATNLPTK